MRFVKNRWSKAQKEDELWLTMRVMTIESRSPRESDVERIKWARK